MRAEKPAKIYSSPVFSISICHFSSDPADPENFPDPLRLVDRPSNIMSHILILKGNPLRRLIGFLSGFLQVFSGCGHTEDTAAVCDDLAFVVEFCSGVEDIIVVFSLELLKSFDRESLFVLDRVAVGCKDNADRRTIIVEL